MPEWVSAAEVRRRILGEHSFTDQELEDLAEDAEDLILRHLPELPRWVEAGQITVRTVRRVAARIILRVLNNPEGIRSISDNTGPYSGSTMFAGDNPGELVMTDDDRKELTPTAQAGRRAFSVMPNYALRG